MMTYVLFHDTTCAACSDIAQTLQTFKELSAISHTGVTGDDYGAIRKTIADNEFPSWCGWRMANAGLVVGSP